MKMAEILSCISWPTRIPPSMVAVLEAKVNCVIIVQSWQAIAVHYCEKCRVVPAIYNVMVANAAVTRPLPFSQARRYVIIITLPWKTKRGNLVPLPGKMHQCWRKQHSRTARNQMSQQKYQHISVTWKNVIDLDLSFAFHWHLGTLIYFICLFIPTPTPTASYGPAGRKGSGCSL